MRLGIVLASVGGVGGLGGNQPQGKCLKYPYSNIYIGRRSRHRNRFDLNSPLTLLQPPASEFASELQ
jgi:hypothetical protein